MSEAAPEITRDFTVATFVIHERRVLLLWHPKLAMWLPPGGHIDPHELPDEAAVREVEQCLKSLIASLTKGAKVGCSTEGDLKDECNAEFAQEREDFENEIEDDVLDAHRECDNEVGPAIRDACLGNTN